MIIICSESDVTNQFRLPDYQRYYQSHQYRQSRLQIRGRDRSPHNQNAVALQIRIRGSIPPVKVLFL